MFPPMELETQSYVNKPMNCPFHIQIYKSRTRSYRDLPLRWGELGTVYRRERSGVLHGMLRVRGFTQDDAHLFLRPEQLVDEILGVLDLELFFLKQFGYEDLKFTLSVRDESNKEHYAGTDEVWELAERALANALNKKKLEYTRAEGEATFYGPKIDTHLSDALGRLWQGPTIQVDFNLPERFDIVYEGQDGVRHRPVMVPPHDPGIDGAVRCRSGRALRGRVPRMARSGAGPRNQHRRPPHRVLPKRGRGVAGGRAASGARRSNRTDESQNPRGPVAKDARIC